MNWIEELIAALDKKYDFYMEEMKGAYGHFNQYAAFHKSVGVAVARGILIKELSTLGPIHSADGLTQEPHQTQDQEPQK